MKKKGLIVFITLILPMSMLGSEELVYTWGYGDVMWEALQALKGLTSELDYVVKMALAVALFVFSISKALDSKTNPVFEIGKLFMLYGVVYFFFLSPSSNTYIIHDEVTNKDYKVSKLPMGIGNTISLMSRLEKAILDGMEKYYSTPNSIAYSQAGLGFSLDALMDIPSLRPVSAGRINLQNNMDLYIRNCLQYNTLMSAINMDDLIKSPSLINLIFLEKDGKLGIWKDKDGKETMLDCGTIAQNLKLGFAEAADEAMVVAGKKAGFATLTDYVTKFENAVGLYFGQAVGAREQFQQIMVMNSLDDGIINTAKMLGLNAQSLAANTAIADQTITTSMQAQGRLAQTYLPLAKAYMTIIVVSVSWLMAIISIMFGSYTHIKMFFTLCLSMVLWTPILSLINYLNDLNIQHTFADLVLKDDGALTYTNFKEVVTKVTNNSNILKYLVMLTPMLAYALAKGSEMGFVSIASSLSQQLAGGARAAGGFATQQALSTSSAITSPRADEMYLREAGITSHKSAFYDSNGNLTSSNTQTNGYGGVENSQISNSVMSGTNVGGTMQGAKLSNAAIESLNSYGQTNATNWKKDFSLAYSHIKEDGQVAALTTSRGFVNGGNEQFAQEWAKNLQEEISNNEKLSAKLNGKQEAYVQVGLSVGGSAAGVRAGISVEQGRELGLDKNETAAFNEALRRSSVKTLSESDSIDSSWAKTLSDKTGYAFQEMRDKGIAYTEAQNSVQSVKSDDLNNLMNGVARNMAANDGADWNSLSTAQQNSYFANAGSMIGNMAQNNPAALQALQKEFGAGGTTSGEKFGVSDFKGHNIMLQANLNNDAVTIRARNAKITSNLPDGQRVKSQHNIDAKKVSENYDNNHLTKFIP